VTALQRAWLLAGGHEADHHAVALDVIYCCVFSFVVLRASQHTTQHGHFTIIIISVFDSPLSPQPCE
jgi:hypothetical protein